MISQVQGTISQQQIPQRPAGQELTSIQKEEVSSILENYDSSSLSQEDAQAIMGSLKDAGITPSRDLANTMRESGFEAMEVGSLARTGEISSTPSGMPPMGPAGGMPPSGGMQGGMPQTQDTSEEENELAILLEELLLQELEESEDLKNEENISSDSTSINNFEDELQNVAAQIAGLNDSSKKEVMDMMQKYTQNEDNLSSEDISSIVSNSLSSILNNSSNYKHSSFYA